MSSPGESSQLTQAKLDEVYKKLVECGAPGTYGPDGQPTYELPRPDQQVRFKEVHRLLTREETIERRLRNLEHAASVFRNARKEYQEAKRRLKAAKKGPTAETITRYVPVRPGEEGYEDLPDRFYPKKYQGEFGWGVIKQP